MCDSRKKNRHDKGDENMNNTKPRPMEHEFKSEEEEKDFAKWANGQKPTSKKVINKIKRDLDKHRQMKKRIHERNH